MTEKQKPELQKVLDEFARKDVKDWKHVPDHIELGYDKSDLEEFATLAHTRGVELGKRQGKLELVELLKKEFRFWDYEGVVDNGALRRWLKSQLKKEAKTP